MLHECTTVLCCTNNNVLLYMLYKHNAIRQYHNHNSQNLEFYSMLKNILIFSNKHFFMSKYFVYSTEHIKLVKKFIQHVSSMKQILSLLI